MRKLDAVRGTQRVPRNRTEDQGRISPRGRANCDGAKTIAPTHWLKPAAQVGYVAEVTLRGWDAAERSTLADTRRGTMDARRGATSCVCASRSIRVRKCMRTGRPRADRFALHCERDVAAVTQKKRLRRSGCSGQPSPTWRLGLQLGHNLYDPKHCCAYVARWRARTVMMPGATARIPYRARQLPEHEHRAGAQLRISGGHLFDRSSWR